MESLVGSFLIAKTEIAAAFAVFAGIIIFVDSPTAFCGRWGGLGFLARLVVTGWGTTIFLIFFVFHN